LVCGRNYCSFLSRALFSNGRVHAFSFSGWLNVSVRTPVGLRSFCSSGAELELSKRRTGFRVRGLAPRFITRCPGEQARLQNEKMRPRWMCGC